jgi:hypothetical protein
MARSSNMQNLAESIAGQHLALSVAAHLARTQLAPEPLKLYDGQHLDDTLNGVALALARTAPLYALDPHTRQPRQLTPNELAGVSPRRGATQLVLNDGRVLGGVFMRRADLRQAIAVLKACGLREFAPQFAAAIEQAQARRGAAASAPTRPTPDELLARLAEVEALLMPPLLSTQVDRAKAGALWIARNAPHGRIANLAMQLMSALQDKRDAEDIPGGYRMALARLRAALEQFVREPTTA